MKKIIALLLAVFLVGCAAPQEKETVTFGLPPWPGATVKTEVAEQILEEQGYEVETTELDAGILYAQLAEGNIDVLLAGWLPVTHKDYWNEHSTELEEVNVNVPETWLGLAVPSYTDIETIEDLKESNIDRIVGIEPGAGITQSTKEAIETYNLSQELMTSSTPSMMAEVDRAIQNEEDIVFTIWEPHSAFAKFDIKKLEDPREVYGGGDVVKTIVRKGFQEDFPKVYSFLQKFEVSPDTQSAWILEYSDKERDPEDVAKEWIQNNQDKVNQWTSSE